MHEDSKEADLYRISLIEQALEDAGSDRDIRDLPPDILTAFIALTNIILEKQRLAMLDPGEDYDAA